jgi:hypothetical protein
MVCDVAICHDDVWRTLLKLSHHTSALPAGDLGNRGGGKSAVFGPDKEYVQMVHNYVKHCVFEEVSRMGPPHRPQFEYRLLGELKRPDHASRMADLSL